MFWLKWAVINLTVMIYSIFVGPGGLRNYYLPSYFPGDFEGKWWNFQDPGSWIQSGFHGNATRVLKVAQVMSLLQMFVVSGWYPSSHNASYGRFMLSREICCEERGTRGNNGEKKNLPTAKTTSLQVSEQCCIWGIILPNCLGFLIGHYKDIFETISIHLGKLT